MYLDPFSCLLHVPALVVLATYHLKLILNL